MPPGGGGLYYLAAQALTAYAEYAGFGIQVNGVYSCYTFGDGRTEHYATVACGSIANLNEGKILFETRFLEMLINRNLVLLHLTSNKLCSFCFRNMDSVWLFDGFLGSNYSIFLPLL